MEMEEKEFWDYYESKILPSNYYYDGTEIILFTTFRKLYAKTDLKGKIWTLYYHIFSNYVGIKTLIDDLQKYTGDTYMPVLFILAHYYNRQYNWQQVIDTCHKMVDTMDQLSKEDPDYYIVYKLLARAYKNIGDSKKATEYGFAWAQVCNKVTGNPLAGLSNYDLVNIDIKEYPKIYNDNKPFYDKYCPFLKIISNLITENIELASVPGGRDYLKAKKDFEDLAKK